MLSKITGSSQVEQAVAMRPGDEPNGISSGPDGTVYLAVPPFVARISPQGKIDATASGLGSGPVDGAPRGATALSSDTVATASAGQLLRISPDKEPAVLAGIQHALRSFTDPVPATQQAATAHFSRYLAPIGTLHDGSLILADGDAIWSLRSGKLTRLYQHPPIKVAGTERPSVTAAGSTVSSDGRIYLLPAAPKATLKDTVVISTTGRAGRLDLPGTIKGIPGNTGDLTPLWLTTDGGNGVYVHAYRAAGNGNTNGEFLLHVHAGQGDLVAASHTQGSPDTCNATKATDAKHFPCPLPWAVTYQPGQLVMAGGEPYVVKVTLPRR
ncbi:hypothetical protein ACWC0C_23795 [Streptomyces sp. NPDC001709]